MTAPAWSYSYHHDLEVMDCLSRDHEEEFDPLYFVDKDQRFAVLNAVCTLSLSHDGFEDDELVSRAKELLGLVDDDIRSTYFTERDAREASEVPHE